MLVIQSVQSSSVVYKSSGPLLTKCFKLCFLSLPAGAVINPYNSVLVLFDGRVYISRESSEVYVFTKYIVGLSGTHKSDLL